MTLLKSVETCALCGDQFCTKCTSKKYFIKWILCENCYNPIDKKRAKRKKRIQEIRANRSKYGKFSLNTVRTLEFKSLIECLNNIYEEATIKLTSKGIVIKDMDPSRVCLFHLNLSNKFFTDLIFYNNPTKMHIELKTLNKILEVFSHTKPIRIYRKTGEKEITIESPVEPNKTLRFEPITVPREEIPLLALGKIEYTASFTISFQKFLEIIKECQNLSDIIQIKGDQQGITFKTKSMKISYKYLLDKKELNTYDIKEISKSSYSLNFIVKFLEPLTELIETIKIYFKKDTPLKIILKLSNLGTLTHYIAPRVEENRQDEF